jgi:signal peptidase I
MMFSIWRKNRADGELLSSAKVLLSQAGKVVKYRRHLLDPSVAAKITAAAAALKDSVRRKNFPTIRKLSGELSGLLEAHGGSIFPVKFLSENAEVLFVATLLAISIRTFFIQSFQIPTNSMYPTYSGMTHVIVRRDGARPTLWQSILRAIRYGGRRVCVTATVSGEVAIPVVGDNCGQGGECNFAVPYEMVYAGKFFGLWKSARRKYSLLIGDVVHDVFVPADFPLDRVLLEKFCGGAHSLNEFLAKSTAKMRVGKRVIFHGTGVHVSAGDSAIEFEILPGDVLFVDKITYNFRPPVVGESVVFKTDRIDAFARSPRFFIKRLIGTPGDVLAIEDGRLLANGKPLESNEILKILNSGSGNCGGGYRPAGSLSTGKKVVVPEKKYFMLGDNSSDSYDSRFWGFVPRESVCGRPLVIFYPFSSRFGRCT